MTLALLLRYWKSVLIAALIITVVGFCKARDNAIAETAAAKKDLELARRENRKNAEAIRITDTLWRHDTVRKAVLDPRYVTLRDTLIQHKTDTTLVDRFIAIADSSRQVCSALEHDCNAFRTLAYQRFDTYEREIKAALAVKPRQHWGLGATVGPCLAYDRGAIRPCPVSLTLGLTYRW